MIYDRTQSDITQAEKIYKEKVLTFSVLSDEEKTILERGRFTTESINRIVEKQKEVSAILSKWHYLKEELENKDNWTSQVFFEEDLRRLVKNNNTLRECFYVVSKNLRNPEPLFHYEEINILEKILVELSELIELTEKSFKRCGTFSADQITLPLKGDTK